MSLTASGHIAYISLWQLLCFYANKIKNQSRKHESTKGRKHEKGNNGLSCVAAGEEGISPALRFVFSYFRAFVIKGLKWY